MLKHTMGRARAFCKLNRALPFLVDPIQFAWRDLSFVFGTNQIKGTGFTSNDR